MSKKSNELTEKWNAIYTAKLAKEKAEKIVGKQHAEADQQSTMNDEPIYPAKVLESGQYWLPKFGDALDLACGMGDNALWLAQHGLQVNAWDISDTAIHALQAKVEQLKFALIDSGTVGTKIESRTDKPKTLSSHSLSVNAQIRDIIANPPEPASFDMIVVSRFLDRGICDTLVDALRPNGVLFYQTFTQGLSNKNYLLKNNELLQLFDQLQVCFYELNQPSESGKVEAMLVAKKLPIL